MDDIHQGFFFFFFLFGITIGLLDSTTTTTRTRKHDVHKERKGRRNLIKHMRLKLKTLNIPWELAGGSERRKKERE